MTMTNGDNHVEILNKRLIPNHIKVKSPYDREDKEVYPRGLESRSGVSSIMGSGSF